MSRAPSKRLPPLEDVFTHHPIAQLLGIRLQSITKSRVRAELPVIAQHMNRGGRVAGGVIMTFADLLGARGTVANLPPGARTTTLESKTNFFAAGEAPLLQAVSIPLHIGRTTMVWQTTVRNADGRMVAVVTQTQMVLMPRTDEAEASSAGPEPTLRKRAVTSGRQRRASSSAGTGAGGSARRVNGSRTRIERP